MLKTIILLDIFFLNVFTATSDQFHAQMFLFKKKKKRFPIIMQIYVCFHNL